MKLHIHKGFFEDRNFISKVYILYVIALYTMNIFMKAVHPGSLYASRVPDVRRNVLCAGVPLDCNLCTTLLYNSSR
jgi:hypothetical protein